MSPERLAGDAYSTSADVWGLGAALVALATGAAPFQANSRSSEEAYWEILGEVRDGPAPTLGATSSRAAAACVAACLDKDAAARPSASELLRDGFLAEAPPPDPVYFRGGAAPPPPPRAELNEVLDAVEAHLSERLASRNSSAFRRRGVAAAAAAALLDLDAGDASRFAGISAQLGLPEDDVAAAVRTRLSPPPPGAGGTGPPAPPGG